MSSTRTRTKSKPVTHVYDSDSDADSDSDSTRPVKRRKTKNECSGSSGNACQMEPGKAPVHPASIHVIANTKAIRSSLLDWYSGVHESRGMPWRKPFDATLDVQGRSQRAYEVWISEIMLQQTQVATVIPYYNRWMNKYPTITDLANSDIESVNAIWKGLGYYSRAARLLSGAKKIVEEYNGLFPDTAKDMMANVPGIGRYSAGAISSIAYNHCEPVLDGNVNRLLSRVLALHANPKAKSTLDILWDGAAAMVKSADEPGNINQALIELGATVCKVRDPDCQSCPLNAYCAAYLETQGHQPEEQDIEELCTLCEPAIPGEVTGVTRYPMKVERKRAREEVDVVNVVEWLSPQNRRYFLLVRRPDTGLLAGLHEFPSRTNVKDSDTPSKLHSIGQDILRDMLVNPPQTYHPASPKRQQPKASPSPKTLQITKMKPAGDVLHIFSHIRKTYRVQWILLEGGDPNSEEPPGLKADYASLLIDSGKSTATKTNTRKSKNKVDERKESKLAVRPVLKRLALRWVKYEDVEDANIGTGIMKVWKKVNELWVDK
ncbi:hypothetical protein EW145_g1137 [Phellinidium pouzarii]|uniref:Adenine DNA glycosylase n=1 Tax=Phellinidium pouzarii TaxID=167371 RepID=A0A4S4LFT4_9AGAM|nr:hypothetical protein EW145_g1137 [Phellinidium pouzarii]